MDRKAQVTAFMILGLVILVTVALIVGVRNSQSLSRMQKQIDPNVQFVAAFYDSCLYESSVQALETLGRQGGYIDIDRARVRTIELTRTAYWSQSRYPSIDSMQSDLSAEISRLLPDCINDYKDVENQFSVVHGPSPEISVVIAAGDVVVTSRDPLDITLNSNGKQYKLAEFSVTLPVRLKDVYDESILILKEEGSRPFLGPLSADLLSLEFDPEIGTLLSPVNVFDRQSSFQDRMYYYMPLIDVESTFYPTLPSFSSDELLTVQTKIGKEPLSEREIEVLDTNFIQQHLTWRVSGLDDPDTRVVVRYWSIYGISFVRSSSTASGPFDIDHATYNTALPVNIEVFDKTAYNGRGYSFNFALPVQIINNEAVTVI